MDLTRRAMLGATAAAALPRIARAQATPTLKLGVLNDMSGPYRDDGGPNGVICCKQALIDFGVPGKGFNVEVIFADHQNKPDVGAGIARQWIDQDGVDAIVDVPTSSVGLAVNKVCREKNKVMLNSGTGTSDLTGKQCSPNTIHWTYDTYMLAKSTGGATVKQGGDTWFFITADYVFGQTLERDTAALVQKAGGKVLGSVRSIRSPTPPIFPRMLVRAQASGAKVLGLCNAGGDTANCIKQAQEFGLMKSMKVVALLIQSTDVKALGLATAQGLYYSELYYWDLNDRTRAWNDRVKGKTRERHLAEHDAGRRLRRDAALPEGGGRHGRGGGEGGWPRGGGADEGDADRRRLLRPRPIREDGRALHPVYLFQAKKPAESKQPWDVAKVIATTPPRTPGVR